MDQFPNDPMDAQRDTSNGVVMPPSASSTDALNQAPVIPEGDPIYTPRRRHWTRGRIVGLALLGIGLTAGAVLVLHNVLSNGSQDGAGALSSRVKRQDIGLSDLSQQLNIASREIDTLTINGQVNVRNGLVLAPTTKTGNPVAGQIYYDQTQNQIGYYNGTAFVYLQGSGSTGTPQQTASASGGGVNLAASNGAITVVTASGTLGNSLLRQTATTVSVAGNINVQGQYQINGAPIVSGNLADATNIAQLNAGQTFTGTNTFRNSGNATSAFTVQDAGGTSLLTVDTTNATIVLGTDGATPVVPIIRGAAAVGNNILGANMIFDAPNGTGVGGSGDFIFRAAGGVSNPQVTFDATNGTEDTSTATPLTWPHTTTGSGADRILIVAANAQNIGSPATVASVTYDGVPLQRIVEAGGVLAKGSVWYMVNPPSGSHVVSVTFNGSAAGVAAESTTFYNVDQADPIGGFTSQTLDNASSITTTLSGTNAGQLVFDALLSRQDLGLAVQGPGQTQRYYQHFFQENAGSTKQGTPGSTTMSWFGPGGSTINQVLVALNPEPNVQPDPLVERLRISQAGTLGLNLGSSENALYDLTFGGTTNRTIAINQSQGTDNGYTLTLRAGDGAGAGNTNGGDVLLQGGAASGTGLGGKVIVKSQTDSAAGFQIQDSAGVALFTANTLGKIITVAGTDTAFGSLTMTNAHIKSTQTTPPTISTPVNCGTTPTAAINTGSTDSAGSFTLTAGSGAIAGPCRVTVTFKQAYGAAPKSVVVTPTTAIGSSPQGKLSLVSTVTAASFTITITPTNPASGELNAFYYWVAE